LRMLHNGELLLPTELEEISKNFRLSYHVENQLRDRGISLDLAPLFKNPFLAYYNTDGSINIARNDYEYFVVAKGDDCFVVVTFKEKSINGFTVTDKRNFALEGKGPRATEGSFSFGYVAEKPVEICSQITHKKLNKGEIYYISNPNGEVYGTELQKNRPAVIISVPGEFPDSLGAVVAFLTTKPKNFSDFHCTIHSSGRPATVLVEQMKYVDAARISDYIATCNDEEIEAIEECILKVHGIEPDRYEKELKVANNTIADLTKQVEQLKIEKATFEGMLTTLYDKK